jgi:hypothetical protein
MASRDLEFIDNASAVATAALARRGTKLNTMNATTGTIAVGALTGGVDVTLITTNATPGNQTLRSAAQLLADQGEVAPYSYNLRIVNTGAGTLTLVADGGATMTLGAGTYTVPTNTFRDFIVAFPTATTGTITTGGVGTWS